MMSIPEAQRSFGAINSLDVLPCFQDNVLFAGMNPRVNIAFAPNPRMEACKSERIPAFVVERRCIIG